MVTAYVLINVKGSSEASRIAKELLKIDEVENIHLVYGEWDIIITVKTKTLIQLREVTLNKILAVSGIGRTHTLIVADEGMWTIHPNDFLFYFII